MDEQSSTEQASAAPAWQIVVFGSAAAVAAALVGVATYVYLRHKAESSPKYILKHCRSSIDQLERSLDRAAHA